MPGTCGHLLAPTCGCPGTSWAPVPVQAEHQDADLPSYQHLDNWMNALSGIGDPTYDKREHANFVVPVIDYQTAISIWRADAMAARAIELLPAECFARGYDITINDGEDDRDFLNDVQDRMEELKVDEIVERCYRYERGFGGGAILMGLKDGGAIDEPLVPGKITSLDWLTVLEPLEIYPASYYQDTEHPKYGEPEYYRQQAFTVSGAGTVVGVTDRRAPAPTNQLIHESRLVVFGGQRVSRYQRNNSLMGPLWGDSILIRVLEALRDYNIAWASAGLLATDFAQSVISVENLMAVVSKQADKVRDRFRAMNMMRSNARAILIDAKEKFQRESTNVTGLPELLDRISQRLAADADIPLSYLLGMSPSGLGQPGQNDVIMMQDRTRSAQTRRLSPVIKFFAKTVMQTMRKRKIPRRIGVEWCNLVHQSDKDLAETRLTMGRADSLYAKMGAIKPDEIRDSRWRRKRYSFETRVDKGPAPGFIAPLPSGVPPATPPTQGTGQGKKPDPRAPNKLQGKVKPNQVGPSAHVVGGYARRNPRKATHESDGGTGHKDADGAGESTTFAGLPVVIESPRGSTREWAGGSTTMMFDYGYIPGANGADGDSIDCYLGPHEDAENAYIIHQMTPPDYTHFDEDKAFLGFRSADHARAAYTLHRDDGDRAIGGVSPMTMEEFRTQYLGSGLASLHSGPSSYQDESAVMSESTAGDRAELEEIHGGWGEQENGFEVDKPQGKEPTDDPLWNQPLKSGGDEEA